MMIIPSFEPMNNDPFYIIRVISSVPTLSSANTSLFVYSKNAVNTSILFRLRHETQTSLESIPSQDISHYPLW